MTTRFQAMTNELTQRRLEAVRQALSLEPSEKALLLDEIAQIAYWVVHQAMEGRRIQACRDDREPPQVLEHVALEALRAPVRLELSADEARKLREVLEASEAAPPPELERTLEVLRELDTSFSIQWEEPT